MYHEKEVSKFVLKALRCLKLILNIELEVSALCKGAMCFVVLVSAMRYNEAM